jgi:hypothetical protein
METFSFTTTATTTLAGTAAPDIITSAVLFADVSDRLDRNVGIAIANPNNAVASITLILRKDDGTQLGTRTITLNGRSQLAQFITELIPVQGSGGFGTPPPAILEYTGSLSLTSNLPISLLALRFRGAEISALPLAASVPSVTGLPVLSQGVGGSAAVLLPQFATGGGWATQVVVNNTTTSSLTVRVDVFNQDGTPRIVALNGQEASSFTNLNIAAGGVLVLAPRDANGDSRF